jgi:predicted anti-sigma-YlaC factor YlaD
MNKQTIFNFIVRKEDRAITVERSFNAPLDPVWAAWTQADILCRWWAPKPYECVIKSLDFREGGRWLYCMQGPQGDQHWCFFDYEEVRPKTFFSGNRARDYCLRSLELKHPGIGVRLAAGDPTAAALVREPDIALLYWTAAAWGKAISISLDRPALINDLPTVRALIERALALDTSFNHGALHDVMIAVESVPEAMGGSPARARAHFERSVELSRGRSAGPYVTFARAVLLPAQKREEFVQVLTDALDIDVNSNLALRLANILAQEQAQFLLDHLDDLFLDSSEQTTR